jgi:hypothetical protein
MFHVGASRDSYPSFAPLREGTRAEHMPLSLQVFMTVLSFPPLVSLSNLQSPLSTVSSFLFISISSFSSTMQYMYQLQSWNSHTWRQTECLHWRKFKSNAVLYCPYSYRSSFDVLILQSTTPVSS